MCMTVGTVSPCGFRPAVCHTQTHCKTAFSHPTRVLEFNNREIDSSVFEIPEGYEVVEVQSE